MSKNLILRIIALKRLGILKNNYKFYINLIKKKELRKTKLYSYFIQRFNRIGERFPEHYKAILDHITLIHNIGYNRDLKSKNLYIYGDSNVGKSRLITLLKKIYSCVNFSNKGLGQYINKKYKIIFFEEFRFTYLPKSMDLESFKMFLEGTQCDIDDISKSDNPTCLFTSNSSLKQALEKKSVYVGINQYDINALINRFDEINIDDRLDKSYVIYKTHNREKKAINVEFKFQVFVNFLEDFFRERFLDF